MGADPNLPWQEVWPLFLAQLGSMGRPLALRVLFPAFVHQPMPAATEAHVPSMGLLGGSGCA